MDKIIFVLIGTKGQYVKMAPVLKEMDRRKIKYRFIHTSQHTRIAREISRVFGLKKPDYYLDKRKDDIVTIMQTFSWMSKCILKSVFKKKEIWDNKKGICFIHGDTPSTLLGLIIAKIAGIKVAHVEAGLRSYNFFHPFPEEIIRIVTTKFADYLFAPSDWSAKNLKNEKVNGKIFNTKANTVFDAIDIALKKKDETWMPKNPYAVAAIHRNETIYVKKNFDIGLKTIEKISAKMKVLFVVHKPTMKKIRQYGWLERVNKNKNIIMKGYYEYFSFMRIVSNAEFVVSDGGGLQEETSFLNIPCLILRRRTEREWGLGITAHLSNFNEKKIDYFIKNYKKFRAKEKPRIRSPSKIIVDETLKELSKL